VLELVRKALEQLGGIEAFVKPGETVLIKPNQAVARLAEEGCTADPLVVGALIRMARNAGAVKIQVAASSEGFLNSIEVMKYTGVAAMAAQEGAEIIDLGSDSTPSRAVDLPEGKVLGQVPVPVPLLETDVIIAVPKAKTDYLDLISGAIEFSMGTINQKWREQNLGDHDTVERFADVMAAVRPDLCVTDALICGEGDGPAANIPRWCGCILASADFVATDVSMAGLLGRDWRKLHFAAACEQRGLGSREPIVWLGTSLHRVAVQAWPGHEGFQHLPVNVLVGGGVTLSGTIGHVKSALDTLLLRGVLDRVISTKGTPTIMIGDIADPEYEKHIAEGPYVVFDDAARPEYRNDARIFFVPGHPVLSTAAAELMKGLGVESGREHPGFRSIRSALGVAVGSAGFAALAAGAMLGMKLAAKRD